MRPWYDHWWIGSKTWLKESDPVCRTVMWSLAGIMTRKILKTFYRNLVQNFNKNREYFDEVLRKFERISWKYTEWKWYIVLLNKMQKMLCTSIVRKLEITQKTFYQNFEKLLKIFYKSLKQIRENISRRLSYKSLHDVSVSSQRDLVNFSCTPPSSIVQGESTELTSSSVRWVHYKLQYFL